MLSRRRFLLTAAAAPSLAPALSWAEAGAPDLLAAAKTPETGHFTLLGLRRSGETVFSLPLPGRGHAAAAHPYRAEAVAFARRPGTFALVIRCTDGAAIAKLTAPEGRHFYGHGVFSADGGLLYTTENAYETGAGRVGIWDASDGYRRLGEISSGGIGPHDMALLPDGAALVVANGGIRTHPASGREKLNLPEMAPNLSYLSTVDGALIDQVGPEAELRLNSMRHLAVAQSGLVAVAMQWQGDPEDGVPLLAFHSLGAPGLLIAEAEPHQLARMQGYAGSVAFDPSGVRAAITSPRGGQVMAWNIEGGPPALWRRPDVCGLATAPEGWLATDGIGGFFALAPDLAAKPLARHGVAFDNHLIALEKFS
ncbi:MAG: DUF1513 domain-containing protein [Pseudomonadota bacterium]